MMKTFWDDWAYLCPGEKTRSFSSHFFHKTTGSFLHVLHTLCFREAISPKTPLRELPLVLYCPQDKRQTPSETLPAFFTLGPGLPASLFPTSCIHIPKRMITYSSHVHSQLHTYHMSVCLRNIIVHSACKCPLSYLCISRSYIFFRTFLKVLSSS